MKVGGLGHEKWVDGENRVQTASGKMTAHFSQTIYSRSCARLLFGPSTLVHSLDRPLWFDHFPSKNDMNLVPIPLSDCQKRTQVHKD